MGEILVKTKTIVVPGEELASGMEFLPSFGTYRDKEKIVASRLGLVNIDGKIIRIIPLSGKYSPKRGDTIIGKVEDVSYSGWRVSTNSAYAAMLSVKDATQEFIARGADLTQYFDVDDYVVAKITNVTSQKLIDLTMRGPGLRKLVGGRVIEVNTNKVPRIIGKQGSMVGMIKDATGCKIIVGQNGLLWLSGEPKSEIVAVEAIRKIEEESHLSGLTERIKEFLEKKTGKKIEAKTANEDLGEKNGIQKK
ncbi:exosome complex protein Rrp4 [Candidatus Woesearchaeota archaeon]|nr:exosome complex protein Rrp4 [Candidatus Woesearchaeota archaeon]